MLQTALVLVALAILARYLFDAFSEVQDRTPNEPEKIPMAHGSSGMYEPSIDDVYAVKAVLFDESHLPLELIDTIIDFAEYWPHTSTRRTGEELLIAAGAPARENKFLVCQSRLHGRKFG